MVDTGREIVGVRDHQDIINDPSRTLGLVAADWIEDHCIHGEGDIAGKPVFLTNEQIDVLKGLYALDKNGRRVYTNSFLSRPKGWAKSELAAFVALFEALGPCRFAGYDDEGFAQGKPVLTPVINCLATTEGQAGNVYDVILMNLQPEWEGPLSGRFGQDAAKLSRIMLPKGGWIRPITSSSRSKDGGRQTFVVFDETHLFDSNELRETYATLKRNMGAKRPEGEPWSLEVSTMYIPGRNSVAEASHKLAQEIREGKRRSVRFLFDHRQAPDDLDLKKKTEIKAGLRQSYGDEWVDALGSEWERRQVDEAWDSRNAPSATRQFTFNQATSAVDSWVWHYDWEAVHDPKPVDPSDEIVIGFDGSKGRQYAVADATALIGVRVADGHVFEIQVWEQPHLATDWEVPRAEVDAKVRAVLNGWNVVAFFADPKYWDSYLVEWEKDFGEKLRVKSSAAHPIQWGGEQGKSTKAAEAFHTAITTKEMTHNGDDALTRHVLNARLRSNRSGQTFGKETPDSVRKVDALAAAVIAWQARLAALGLEEPAKKGAVLWGY